MMSWQCVRVNVLLYKIFVKVLERRRGRFDILLGVRMRDGVAG